MVDTGMAVRRDGTVAGRRQQVPVNGPVRDLEVVPERSPWPSRLGWTIGLLVGIAVFAFGGFVVGQRIGGPGAAAPAGSSASPSPTPSPSAASPSLGGLTQADVEQRFRAAGVEWTSTGSCSDRTRPDCTSFEGLRITTVEGVLSLANASGCTLTVTGGTEAGHAPGQYSHETGYKVSFRSGPCLTNFITGMTKVSNRKSDGAEQYLSKAGNVYARTGAGWDAQFGVPDSEPLP
jgi:hypothetical protein